MYFSTADDTPASRQALMQAQHGALGWALDAAPPAPLRKMLMLTNGPVAEGEASWRVQPLPAGGIAAMGLHTPYAVVSACPNWSMGMTALVMTVKNDNIATADYPRWLREHVALVVDLFVPQGLDGYLVWGGQDYEWAYLHWPSAAVAQQAFASARGAQGPAHSRSFQHVLCANMPLPASPGALRP